MNLSKKADFLVDDTYTFEVSGKRKGQKQIEGIENTWIVKNDIELPMFKTMPLWMFGLLY